MSLAQKPVQPVLVYDSRLDFDNPKYYSVLKGGKQITYQKWNPASVSNANITWTAVPPGGTGTCIDRRMFIEIPIRAQFTVRNLTVPAADNYNPAFGTSTFINRFGPRSFPLSKAISSMKAKINSVDVTTNLGDYFNGIERYLPRDACKGSFSPTPCAYDKFEYGNTNALNNSYAGLSENPLGGWGNGGEDDVNSRVGSVRYKIVRNNTVTDGDPAVANFIVDFVFTEPIFMTPMLISDKTNGMSFYNVNNFTLTLNFYPNAAARMFECIPYITGGLELRASDIVYTFQNFQTAFTTGADDPDLPAFSFPLQSQPYLYINYLTPPERLNLNPSTYLQYPWFEYELQTTNLPNPFVAGTITSNNFQLASIPRRVYIWLAPLAGSMSQTVCVPDTFLSILNLKINFGNSPTLLSEASQEDLYQMSVKNGYTGDFSDWTKGPVYPWSFGIANDNTGVDYPDKAAANAKILSLSPPTLYLSGSVFCAEFGTDIELNSAYDAPGSNSGKNYNFQVTVQYAAAPINYTAVFGANQVPDLTYAVHCLFSYEGIFNIPQAGQASTNINVLSEADVINAMQQPGINYATVEAVQGGVINFSNMKEVTRNIAEAAKKINRGLKDSKALSKTLGVISDVAGIAPVPYSQQASNLARQSAEFLDKYGYGSGGVLLGTGGAYTNKKELSKFAKNVGVSKKRK